MSPDERRILQSACGIADMLNSVCQHFCVTREQLTGKDRHASLALARQVASWLLRERGYSYPEIGAMLARDHTTIMSGVRKVERLRAVNPRVAETIERMRGVNDARVSVEGVAV